MPFAFYYVIQTSMINRAIYIFILLFISTSVVFFATEVFLNSQYKSIFLGKILSLFVAALVSTTVIYFSIKTQSKKNSISVQVTDDWETFWGQFITLMEKEDFSPVCVMENTYYFERKMPFINHQISITKSLDKSIKITFPSMMGGKINRHFSIYKEIEKIRVGL